METTDRIIEILAAMQGLPKEDIDGNTGLWDDLALDSLDVIELCVTIENAFSIRIPEDLPEMKTVSDLAAFTDSLSEKAGV